MNQLAEVAYREAANRAKASLEDAGYDVLVNPADEQLPKFLEGIAPDIIARKGRDSVVVGIRTIPATADDTERLKRIAEEIQKRKDEGWRFDLYLARPRQELLDAPLQPSSAEIEQEIGTARSILKNEGSKGALVYAWALLEALARILVLDELKGEAKRYKPGSVVTLLVSEGFLEDEEGDRLHKLADQRNLVVHGFTKAEVREDDVAWLIGMLDKLLQEAKQS